MYNKSQLKTRNVITIGLSVKTNIIELVFYKIRKRSEVSGLGNHILMTTLTSYLLGY